MKSLLFLIAFISTNTLSQELIYKVKDKLSQSEIQKLNGIMSDYDSLEKPQRKGRRSRFANRLRLKKRRSGKSFNKSEMKDKMKVLKESKLFDYIEENTVEHEIAFEINDPGSSQQWHHPKIDTLGAWEFTQGSENIIVAVCDSGVDANHEDLQGRVLRGYNFVNNNTDSSPATSHGTLVAGLIAANANNRRGGFGIAPKTMILPLRITNDGSTFLSTIVECIEYAADNNAHVINVSFTGINAQSIQAAGEYAKSRGAVVVYSAGNQGEDRDSWPDHRDILAVGSTTTSDLRSNFSNFGPFIDIVAPGSSVYTTNLNSTYSAVSGTSFSAPIVAGAAALLYALNEDATPDEVESFLKLGADDLRNQYVYGHGRLNINESIRLASESWGGNRAPSSVIEYDSSRDLTAPVQVQFSSGSVDQDGSITSTEWSINGEVFNDKELTYSFELPGSYEIILTVVDDEGERSSTSRIIEIKEARELSMSVADIALKVFYTRSRARTEARVKVVDDVGEIVRDARVLVDIDGVQFFTFTDSEGIAFFNTPFKSRNHRFFYKVLSVEKEGYDYNSGDNRETSDNIRAKKRPWWRFW